MWRSQHLFTDQGESRGLELIDHFSRFHGVEGEAQKGEACFSLEGLKFGGNRLLKYNGYSSLEHTRVMNNKCCVIL